jgi:hypothetical protein
MTLDLAAADGSRYVHAVIGKTKVAAGEYQVRSLKQEKTDDHGVTWTLAGSWYKEGPTLTVEDGKPVEASFGPPLKPQVKATPKKARPGTQVSLAFTFTGQGGEEYRAGNVLRNGKRPPEPQFEIVDANDKVVTSGKFHYG